MINTDYGASRPSDTKMKYWRDLGFVMHSPLHNEIVCYEWVNWALIQAGDSVRVTKGDTPVLDFLQVLYTESMKYLEECNK